MSTLVIPLRNRALWGALAAGALLASFALAQEGEQRRRPQRPQRPETPAAVEPAPAPGQTPAATPAPAPAPPSEARGPKRGGPPLRLKVTAFRIELTPESALELDAAALEREAASPAKLAQALTKFGSPELMFRIDQVVPTEGAGRADSSRDIPYVTAKQVAPDGKSSQTIARDRVGTSVDYVLHQPLQNEDDRRVVFATLRLEFEGLFPSDLETGEVKAPVFWKTNQSHGGELELNRYYVLISFDRQTAMPSSQPQAFVSLVSLCDP